MKRLASAAGKRGRRDRRGAEYARRAIERLAALFDSTAPETLDEAEEELDAAGLDAGAVGEYLAQLARAGVAARLAPEAESRPATSYDPFARGPFAAGVRTLALDDPARGHRPLAVEVWYPAAPAHNRQDREPATRDRYALAPGFPEYDQEAARDAALRPGLYPLVVFSHGSFGHRRQSAFLCTHLASHGYIVAAADHAGNTALDLAQMARLAGFGGDSPERIAELGGDIVAARVPDVRRLIDEIAGGAAAEISNSVDAGRIGIAGHGLGGWAALSLAAVDLRLGACLALAPAGISDPPPGTLRPPPVRAWRHDTPTLLIAAERDTLLPLAQIHELFRRLPVRRRLVVLRHADQFHFCDRAEQTHESFRRGPHAGPAAWIGGAMAPIDDLCPGEHAHLLVRGLALAHMDAHLRGSDAAALFLESDLRAVMAERGVEVAVAAGVADSSEAAAAPPP